MDANDNPMGGGGEDLYADDLGGKAPEAPKPETADEPAGDTQEAILPRSILGGKEFKVGDEVVLKITAMHDKEVSVAYAPAKGGDKEGGAEPEGDNKAAVPAGMEDDNYT